MKNNRLFLMGVILLLLIMLNACGNSGDESNNGMDNATENMDSYDNSTDSAAGKNGGTDESERGSDRVEDDVEAETESPTNESESMKAEFLNRLEAMKIDTEEKRNNTAETNTYELKTIEGNLFDLWDGMLNEIYGVLKEQLPSAEMDQLRTEQRAWIDVRDRTAKEASLKYEGGTMENLEYTVVLNNLTQERCFELVENYMN